MKKHERNLDGTKLMTVPNYAASIGVPKQSVYYKVKQGTIDFVVIDGVTFIIK